MLICVYIYILGMFVFLGKSSYHYQLAQSLVLDYSWSKTNQGGKLTRIVNGMT